MARKAIGTTTKRLGKKLTPDRRRTLLQPSVLDVIKDMLVLRYTEHMIQEKLIAAYGHCFSERQFQDAIMTARASLILNSKKSKEIAFAESIGFYEQVIRSDTVEARYKIAAQTRLDALMSLEPNKSNQGLDPEMIAEKLRMSARAMEIATAIAAGTIDEPE